MLIGNVGKEPDIRYYEADQAVAQIVLATTERGYTLSNGTKVPEHTDWHNVILWKNLAKVVEKYVHKGDKLYIEGRIRYKSYDDQQGKRNTRREMGPENRKTPPPTPAGPPAAESSSQEGVSNATAGKDKLPF